MNIPQELKEIPRWLNYTLIWNEKGKKFDKKPHCKFKETPDSPYYETFKTFDDVTSISENIGFVFSKSDDICGVDIDYKEGMDKDEFEKSAQEIIKKFDSYTEKSVSGKGYHIIFKSKDPKIFLNKKKYDNIEIELYDKERFFAMTGNHISGEIKYCEDAIVWFIDKYLPEKQTPVFTPTAPSSIPSVSDQTVIDAIRSTKQQAKFDALMSGDVSSYDNDVSSADGALTLMLASYTDDRSQIESIWKQSRLGDARQTYSSPGNRNKMSRQDYVDYQIDSALSTASWKWNYETKSEDDYSTLDANCVTNKKLWTKDKETGQKCIAKKQKFLTRDDYKEIFNEAGFKFQRNVLDNSIIVNNDPMDEFHRADIYDKLRTLGVTKDSDKKNAFMSLASDNPFNPIKNYLESIKTDDKDYIKDLSSCFKDEDGLFPKYFKQWIVGAVAKIYEQTQNRVLILSGKQNIGKSKFAAWLGTAFDDNYFNESGINPRDKDTRIRLTQIWVWEIAELGGVAGKSGADMVKQILTQEKVAERKSYGKEDTKKPTITSFIGTVNDASGFLTDPTGSRRYAVCTVTDIDWERYSKIIDPNKIWMQALKLYKSGFSWLPTKEELIESEENNKQYEQEDTLEATILKNFEINPELDHEKMYTSDIVSKLVSGFSFRPDGLANKVGAILKKHGLKRKRDHTKGYFYEGIQYININLTGGNFS